MSDAESSTLLSQVSDVEDAFNLAICLLKYADTKDVARLARYLGIQHHDLETQRTVLASRCLQKSLENYDTDFICSVLVVFLKTDQLVYRESMPPKEYREWFSKTLKEWMTDSPLN
jgi:chaperone required for assembly of F1-ATPase